MNGNTILRFIAIMALSATAACGGGDSGSIAIESLEDKLVNGMCAVLIDCGQAEDEASCRESIGADMTELVQAVEDGRVEYDGEAAAECLDGQFAGLQGCSILDYFGSEEPDPACERTFSGTVAVGGTCYIGEECAGEAYCDQQCNEGECCAGTCMANEVVAEVEIGEDCSEADCVDGAYCAFDDATSTNVCRELVGEGAECESFSACRQGLLCSGGFFEAGVCYEPPDEGETCDPAQICLRLDNFCDPSDMKCKKVNEVGANCDVELDSCVGYATCSEEGMCQASPGLDEACEVDVTECLGDLECVDGTCQLLVEEPCGPM